MVQRDPPAEEIRRRILSRTASEINESQRRKASEDQQANMSGSTRKRKPSRHLHHRCEAAQNQNDHDQRMSEHTDRR